jgi:hypothetical protein
VATRRVGCRSPERDIRTLVAQPRKDGSHGSLIHPDDLEPMVLVRIAFQNDFGSSVAIDINQQYHFAV